MAEPRVGGASRYCRRIPRDPRATRTRRPPPPSGAGCQTSARRGTPAGGRARGADDATFEPPSRRHAADVWRSCGRPAGGRHPLPSSDPFPRALPAPAGPITATKIRDGFPPSLGRSWLGSRLPRERQNAAEGRDFVHPIDRWLIPRNDASRACGTGSTGGGTGSRGHRGARDGATPGDREMGMRCGACAASRGRLPASSSGTCG